MENLHQNPYFWTRIRYIIYKILSDPYYPPKYFINYNMDIVFDKSNKRTIWEVNQDKNYLDSIKKMLCLKKEQLTKNI